MGRRKSNVKNKISASITTRASRVKADALNQKRAGRGAWVADIVLTMSGLSMFIFYGDNEVATDLSSSNMRFFEFLVVISVVPWYMGYLLAHFRGQYNLFVRRFVYWIFGIVTVSLVGFLASTMLPYLEGSQDFSGFEAFMTAFGPFMMVLGPLMLVGGMSDAHLIDNPGFQRAEEREAKPSVTFVMLVIGAAFVFMYLIMMFFDPTLGGDTSSWAVVLAIIGGPLAAILLAVPFIYSGKAIRKFDRYNLMGKITSWLVPLLVFGSLVWWNDIVLYQLSGFWEGGEPTPTTIFWSLMLSGVLPFRLVIVIKPPFRWITLVTGLVSMICYFVGVLYAWNAL